MYIIQPQKSPPLYSFLIVVTCALGNCHLTHIISSNKDYGLQVPPWGIYCGFNGCSLKRLEEYVIKIRYNGCNISGYDFTQGITRPLHGKKI